MKLNLEESTPGEFDQLSAEDLAGRLLKALSSRFPDVGQALLALAPAPPCDCGSCEGEALTKAAKAKIPKRGGELQLVEDLSSLLSKSYANTLKRMSAHIEAKAAEAVAAAPAAPAAPTGAEGSA